MTSGPKPRLIFFGNERLVSGLDQTDAPVLNGLIDAGYDVAAVVSHHTDTRSRKPRPLEVAEIAQKHHIPVFLPENPMEIYQELADFKADVAILIAYGKIVPKELINLFPKGIINIHPSLLPKYRGPTPIETPILNGDRETGVSIMQLTPGLDEGPVFAQKSIKLSGEETKFELYEKLKPLATDLLLDSLPGILSGSLPPQPQDHQAATFSNKLEKSDGILDPNHLSAEQAERRVRAYLGFPKTRIVVDEKQLIVTKAHVSPIQKTPLDVMFLDQKYLSIDELIAPSGKIMSAESYLRGYKK